MAEQMRAPDDPIMVAGIALVRRTGARDVVLGFADDISGPPVWYARAAYAHQPDGEEPGTWYDACGAMTPWGALYRLLEVLVDDSLCGHCGRPTGVEEDYTRKLPLSDQICWYVYDPELATFRRSCEGETTGRQFTYDPATGRGVGRNDPCPCDSGRKFKLCHGA